MTNIGSNTLAFALNNLAAKFSTEYKAVKQYILNPKALSMDQLYGSYDVGSREWTDGVLPSINVFVIGASLNI